MPVDGSRSYYDGNTVCFITFFMGLNFCYEGNSTILTKDNDLRLFFFDLRKTILRNCFEMNEKSCYDS